MSEVPNEQTPEAEQEWEHPQEAPDATLPPAEGEGDATLPGETTEPQEAADEDVSTEQPAPGPEDPDMEPPTGTFDYTDTPSDEPEADPEPEPQAALSEKDIDRIHAKMEKYRADNAERIGRILGGEFEHAAPCPLCSHFSPGYIGLVDVPDDAIPAMRAMLGMPDLSEFAPDPEATACPICAGKGQTLTGSLVPEQVTRTCPRCMGRGWVGTGAAPPNGQPPADAEAVMTGPLYAVADDDDPAIAALKSRGFTVIPPMQVPQA